MDEKRVMWALEWPAEFLEYYIYTYPSPPTLLLGPFIPLPAHSCISLFPISSCVNSNKFNYTFHYIIVGHKCRPFYDCFFLSFFSFFSLFLFFGGVLINQVLYILVLPQHRLFGNFNILLVTYITSLVRKLLIQVWNGIGMCRPFRNSNLALKSSFIVLSYSSFFPHGNLPPKAYQNDEMEHPQ